MSISEMKVLILDFGSQYTQLIARRVRESNVYCEIHSCDTPFEKIKEFDGKGIILSGSPFSIYDETSPDVDKRIFDLDLPILGICYGMQIVGTHFGGKVERSDKREYGRAHLNIVEKAELFQDIDDNTSNIVWMSHGDKLSELPQNFTILAHTENAPYAAIKHKEKPFYAIQFHPEVTHTEIGDKILRNFAINISKASDTWNPENFIDYSLQKIRDQVKGGKVLCGLSGGVDSSVAAVLIHKAIGDNLVCIFVDNGLLRLGEREQVEKTFRDKFKINLVVVDASSRFLSKLKGITDPEQKRKVIGNEFIRTFEEESAKLGEFDFLAQGTLYPDVIESVSFKGPSATIKTHHNVGGLPEDMKFQLCEPLRELFKDEVRRIGYELGIDRSIIGRHPFPGPGLGVRILGEVTQERCKILQQADSIAMDLLTSQGLYDEIWQAFCVLLPVNSVGVMGDERTYENVIALRAVTSTDGMTADWYHMPHESLSKISTKIINEVEGVNRVVYDISSKPPATIEWE